MTRRDLPSALLGAAVGTAWSAWWLVDGPRIGPLNLAGSLAVIVAAGLAFVAVAARREWRR